MEIQTPDQTKLSHEQKHLQKQKLTLGNLPQSWDTSLSGIIKSLQEEFPRLWLVIRHHRTTKNEPLRFSNRKYLVPIYKDHSVEIVIRKAVQVGISDWAICDAFTHCDAGRSVFYVFPTQSLRSTFVQNRIDKAKVNVPYYAQRLQEFKEGADSTILKHFGQGVLKMVGSNAITEFGEFPADCVIIDERDFCNFENLPYARNRLHAAPIKFYREIGNPTIEGDGIDASYHDSDQKVWMIPCQHCGEWQIIDFFINVIRQISDSEFELLDKNRTEDSTDDIRVYCKFCGKPMDRLGAGEHVASRNHHRSGYALSNLISPTVSIKELWEAHKQAQGNQTLLQIFYNSLLGLPYTAKGAKLTLALMQACLGEHVLLSTSTGSYMGVDVGKKLHTIIRDKDEAGHNRLIHIASYNEFEQLERVMAQFNVRIAVIDAEPETRKVREFQKKMGRRVWLCDYIAQPSIMPIKKNEQERIIQADRTQTLDSSGAEIELQEILFPKNFARADNGDFLQQMCAVTRTYDTISKTFKYKEPAGVADHYRHAYNYAWMAQEILRLPKPVMVRI